MSSLQGIEIVVKDLKIKKVISIDGYDLIFVFENDLCAKFFADGHAVDIDFISKDDVLDEIEKEKQERRVD